MSGKISLKDATAPTLRFYYIGKVGEDAEPVTLIVGVSESFNGQFTAVLEKEFSESSEWLTAEIPLNAYVGKEIYLSFNAIIEYGPVLIGIDDVTIREAIDYDAAIEAAAIDKDEVEVGVSMAKVSTRVQNHNMKELAAGSYKVSFYAGERCFATLDGQAMEANFGQSLYETDYIPSVDDTDPAVITVRIESDLDTNPLNDISKALGIYVIKPKRPVVDDLLGKEEEDGYALTWTKPDQSGLPVREVLDDFESYRMWDNNRAGQWTIIDEDQSPGCSVSYFFPGSNGPMGWVVMHPAAIARVGGGTHADRCPTYSGEQYMVAYNPASGDNKDWLITPELSGRAHKISFMARAESAKQGREMFEVYYSKTGNALTDMISLDNTVWRTELKDWHEYSFDVPEGTKYFAVRCVSHSRLAMHIDDFKYESAPTPLEVTFVGYNVYRDGQLLNDMPLLDPSYLDRTVEKNHTYRYTVRVVYDRGESDHSNEVEADLNGSGIKEVSLDINLEEEAVYDLRGIRVHSLTDGEIYVVRGSKFRYRANPARANCVPKGDIYY